ncbi:acetyl-CoA synthetase [Halarchaeum solikamskense]|uniref:acyl-CoA synthetase n=1 Tax=Halarchaeum nitratireducens TaxID=489913 RepID=UPI001B3AD53D|nr:AMP-binding protein [Halarchaeum solikamskense]MBP2249998.1 acetyl-CoA synthetase [Halarchaeum solikamskense]
MDEIDRLENYYFHEQGFDTIEEAREWFEWEIPETFNIAHYVCDRWAAAKKNGVALYIDDDGEERTYTFRQLRGYANRFANYLDERGVEAGDRIAVNGTQRLQSLVAHLAAFKLGAVTVPLSVLLGTDGLRYRLDDSDAVAFVVDEGAIETFRPIRDDLDSLSFVVTSEGFDRGDETCFWDAIEGRSTEFETRATDPADPACIIYTSGTTGQPKGAVHAHRHLLGLLPQFVSLQGHETGDEQVVRTISEWSWIMSLNQMVLPPLFYGIPVVGRPEGKFDAEAEFELVERFEVTQLNLPPTAVRMMMQVEDADERYDLTSLQSFSTGGESAGESIIDWATTTFENAAFVEGYGSTEVGGLISDDPGFGIDHRIDYFGVPSVGHEVAVLDPDTREEVTEPGEIGELAVRYEGDPMLFVEYLGKPEATAEKVQDGWLLSEDLVSRDEDGYFQFHARDDDLIISSGYRFGPDEIEEALVTHDAVSEAGVIGVPHETRGEIPKAFIVLADGYEASDDLRDDLQAHVKERLAKYEYPRELAFVRTLPRTSTGKIRRTELRQEEGIEEP